MSAKAPTMRVLGRLPEGVTYSDSSRWQGVASVTNPTVGSIGDGVVNFADLALMKKSFFKAPGPAAGKP